MVGQAWNETSQVIAELGEHLKTTPLPEVKLLTTINEIQKEIDSIFSQRTEDGKKLIRGMSMTAEKKKQESVRKGETEHRARVEGLEQEKSRALKHNREFEQQCNNVDKEGTDVKKENEDIQRRLREVEEAKNVLIPRVKDALSLYNLISCVRWDYDATEKVKGYILTNSDVKPFNFAAATPSGSVDALWDMLD